MSSSYSPDLRFELVANGEQSGVWGNTTNNNIGTLIEQAIAGAATVTTISASQALTVFNGASDESRCSTLVLNTVTTANYNVYVPPVPKLYVVKNASASYTCTIYASTVAGNTTAAGSGITVPASTSMLVRCDGTNIVDQVNYISGALTVGGTMTLSANPTTSLQAATKQYVDTATSGSFPSGGIIMWSGLISAIPSGWHLCDGTSGTPNLLDRFIVGAGNTYSVGGTGGYTDSTLVSHSHTYSGNTNSAGSHHHPVFGGAAVGNTKGLKEAGAVVLAAGVNGTGSGFQDTLYSGQQIVDDNGSHSHSFSGTTSSAGSSPTGTNLPPYYALAYIMKL